MHMQAKIAKGRADCLKINDKEKGFPPKQGESELHLEAIRYCTYMYSFDSVNFGQPLTSEEYKSTLD